MYSFQFSGENALSKNSVLLSYTPRALFSKIWIGIHNLSFKLVVMGGPKVPPRAYYYWIVFHHGMYVLHLIGWEHLHHRDTPNDTPMILWVRTEKTPHRYPNHQNISDTPSHHSNFGAPGVVSDAIETQPNDPLIHASVTRQIPQPTTHSPLSYFVPMWKKKGADLAHV